jgi:hypothetical protein
MRGIDRSRRRKPEQPGCDTSGTLEQVGAPALRGVHERWLEELTDDAECEVALELGPARAKHSHSARSRSRAGGIEQRRLADPSRALDHEERAPSGISLGQRPFDPRELFAPLDQ